MENVLLKNGDIQTIFNNSDIVSIVEEFAGNDLACIIDKRLVDVDKEKLYAQALVNTDAEAYLTSLEEKEEVLRETIEVMEELEEYLTKTKRLNRDYLFEKIHALHYKLVREL